MDACTAEARTAVRAIDERVAVAPVSAIEELSKAVGAGGGVWCDRLKAVLQRPGCLDREVVLTKDGHRRGLDRLDPRQRRSLRPQRGDESGQLRRAALDLDLDRACRVAAPAAHPVAT